MREVNASFKTAVKFINWRTPGPAESGARQWNGRPDHFYHPFGLLPNQDQVPLSHYWSYKRELGLTDEHFDYACFREPAMMDAKRAPRWSDGRPATFYAWHFDAAKVAAFLTRFATEKLGVVHIQDEMRDLRQDERGFVTALVTAQGRTIEGDLFVDCSGFRGLLINQAMAEPFINMSDHLLNDRAVATAVPHDDATHGIEPYTSAIAMPSGWTWRIPMPGRFGSGYVYSSSFASQDQATEDFCRMWELSPDTEFNHVKFRVGRNRRAWVRNVVSIGLSSCFVEPLESSGIYFIYAAIYQLAKHFPDKRFDQILVDRFNKEIETMFDDTRDFLQAHYFCSPRMDTPFWKANKDLELSENIREKLAMFKAGIPINPPATDEGNYYGSFEAEFRNFWTNGSYYCIFTGMGLQPDHALPSLTYRPASIDAAEQLFTKVKRDQRELVAGLPSNYEYLRELHGTRK